MVPRTQQTRSMARVAARTLTALTICACNVNMPKEKAFIEKVVVDVRAGAPVPYAPEVAQPNDESIKAVDAIRASSALRIEGMPTGNQTEACFNGTLEMRAGGERPFGIRVRRNPPFGVMEMTAEHECVCAKKGTGAGRLVDCHLQRRSN